MINNSTLIKFYSIVKMCTKTDRTFKPTNKDRFLILITIKIVRVMRTTPNK